MSPVRRLGVLAAWLVAAPVWAAPPGAAPERAPHLGYIYPAGGQQGTTVEAVIGGEYVYGATASLVSGTGVTVRVIDSRDPSEGKEGGPRKKRRGQSVIDEIVKLSITLTPKAAPGERELRLVTPGGLSDPVIFQVGQLKEVGETEPNEKPGRAVPLPILPVTVNGQILPGDLDVFEFSARKGQRIVAEVSARALIPYLADAVPGWFQATLALSDAQGRELTYADDYKFNPDPVLCGEIPSNGVYRLTIRDSIGRGRADFVYRIRLGELPFITSVFPLGARHGYAPVPVTLTGWNLPGRAASVSVAQSAPGVVPVSVTREGLAAPSVPFAVGNEPDVFEDEAPARQGQGQPVLLPVTVNGRIGAPGERDAFTFAGKAGQVVRLDVRARRLGSPLDSQLLLCDAAGTRVGVNDDVKDRGQGLITHQADSELTVTLPHDGRYTVTLFDTQGRGGDDYAYRLRLGAPVPDFELRAMPASLSVPRGGNGSVTVQAIRREGFTGAIGLALDEASVAGGLSLAGGLIPEGADQVRVTLSASGKARAATFHPCLTGTAMVDGAPLVRRAVPAQDLMQAFIYRHLVPARDWVVMATDPPAPFTVTTELPAAGVLELAVGRELTFALSATRRPGFDGPLKLDLVDPPKGITLRRGFIPPGKTHGAMTLRTESKVAAGLRENLILSASMPIEDDTPTAATGVRPAGGKAGLRPAAGATNAPAGAKRLFRGRVSVTMPALPFQTVDRPEKAGSDAGKTP